MFRRFTTRKSLKLVLRLCLALVAISFAMEFSFARAGTAQDTSSAKGRGYVRAALNSMGSEEKLRALETVRFRAVGHRNLLEQSERPEGPYIVEYDEISEERDFTTNSLRQKISGKVATQSKNEFIRVVTGGAATQTFGDRRQPGGVADVQRADEELSLGPERILLAALDASDLHFEADQILQSVTHHIVVFTVSLPLEPQRVPVRVFLNANTGLPTAVEWVSAYPYGGFWSTWGDVTTRVYYSFWWRAQAGIHYPLQWDTVRNGLHDQTWTLDQVEINPTLPASDFVISEADRVAYEIAAKGTEERVRTGEDKRPLGDPVEFAPGILFFAGAWNTTLVRQADGIVILEAPISSLYSQRVIAEVEKRFPGVRIKAVISTSDSWPHFSGIREYVARGIPIYILDLNKPVLQRFVTAPRKNFPDALAKTPRAADFRIVSGKTILGEGSNRLEIYPLRGETSERQMMVYFPEHHILYGSDPFQKRQDGTYFYPQTVGELIEAVEREKLSVDKFFMMHVALTPWSELPAAIAKADAGA